MIRPSATVSLLLLVAALPLGPAKAQEGDYVISGGLVRHLKIAITLEPSLVPVRERNLRERILSREAGAFIFPRRPPAGATIPYRFSKQVSADPERHTLNPDDYTSLKVFAELTIRSRIAELTDPDVLKDPDRRRKIVNTLLKEVDGMKRMVMERYIGGILSEHRGLDPELDSYVDKYRASVEEQARTRLAKLDKVPLAMGKPIVFGPTTDLGPADVKPGEVKDLNVNGHTYRTAWKGSSLVVVRPDPASLLGQDPDPTGLGISFFARKPSIVYLNVRPDYLPGRPEFY